MNVTRNSSRRSWSPVDYTLPVRDSVASMKKAQWRLPRNRVWEGKVILRLLSWNIPFTRRGVP